MNKIIFLCLLLFVDTNYSFLQEKEIRDDFFVGIMWDSYYPERNYLVAASGEIKDYFNKTKLDDTLFVFRNGKPVFYKLGKLHVFTNNVKTSNRDIVDMQEFYINSMYYLIRIEVNDLSNIKIKDLNSKLNIKYQCFVFKYSKNYDIVIDKPIFTDKLKKYSKKNNLKVKSLIVNNGFNYYVYP